MLSFTILSLTSLAFASQVVFEDYLPHPSLWNGTCSDDDIQLKLPKRPFCPNSEYASTPSPTYSPHAPWTQKSKCLRTSDDEHLFCLYTNADFAGGRGISIFTTPQVAEHIAKSAAFMIPEVLDDVNREVNPPFAVQPLPGRGMGVIMNRTVHRGDSLFSYTPVFIIHRKLFSVFDGEHLYPFQREAVDRLPAHARELFLALHGHFGGDKVDDIIHTNSFSVSLGPADGEAHNIVLPETSRMNHDCRPNAHYYFDVDTLTHHTHAIRTIQSGEELTISYTDGTVSREKRQAAIKLSWGFDCSCSLCTQRDVFVRESDRRLELIAELETHLDDWTETSQATPDMAEAVISLYQQERLHAPIALAYTYAALAYNAVGKRDAAVKYSSLALEANIINSGPEFSDVEAMRDIMYDPEGHWSWNMRLKIKS